jgi:hypothetical protein
VIGVAELYGTDTDWLLATGAAASMEMVTVAVLLVPPALVAVKVKLSGPL